jgi:integrase
MARRSFKKKVLRYESTDEKYKAVTEKILGEIGTVNRKKAMEFIEHLKACGIKPSRHRHYIKILRDLDVYGKSYNRLSRKHLEQIISQWYEKYKPRTVTTYKCCLKRFYRWLYNGDCDEGEYPEVVRWIKLDRVKKNLGKQVLTKEEVYRFIEVCENQRDRALLMVLWDSGCRIGELLNLKIGDIELCQQYASIRVNGKTGERKIHLVESLPELQLWLQMHPKSNNPDKPLWIDLKDGEKPIQPPTVLKLVRKYAGKAGLNKKVSPHSFRHSRATELAKVLTEQELKVRFGWIQDSKMASTYVHLSGKDVENKILSLYGVAQPEPSSQLTEEVVKVCPRCRTRNSPIARYCMNCSLALDVKVAIEHEKLKKEQDSILAEIVSRVIAREPMLVAETVRELGLEERIIEVYQTLNQLVKGNRP